MSSSLYWEPVPKEPKRRNIGSLKWLLINKYGGEDFFPREVDESLIPFLQGLNAGSSDGDIKTDVIKLIKAIQDNGSVILTLVS